MEYAKPITPAVNGHEKDVPVVDVVVFVFAVVTTSIPGAPNSLVEKLELLHGRLLQVPLPQLT